MVILLFYGLALGGILTGRIIHINAERNRSNQLYTEIVSKREMADTELRAKMFENLIKCFFGSTSQQKTDKEKLTLLRLLALNFHEFFDLKPLFEELNYIFKFAFMANHLQLELTGNLP